MTEAAIPGQGMNPAQLNAENQSKLERAVTELLVSSYDPVVGKTIWQCAQCHFSSKVRYTVKQHIETHLSGFTHQCPQCDKQCKTKNALRAHIMRTHTARQPGQNQQGNWSAMSSPDGMTPDGMMQVQFHEMGDPQMKAPRRPRQRRPHDAELERQIRLLLISSYDSVESKTTWSCAQCQYSSKLQYTVKQHIETHITSIVHQCAQCPKILKTRNALRAHMIQKHEPGPVRSPPWMGGGGQQNYPMSPQSSIGSPQSPNQMQYQQRQPQQRRKRSEFSYKRPPNPMDAELDRQVAELMVSNYDAAAAKTTWQCAQCHFSSKIRSTVKEHIETHISGFTHQCQFCVKTCKTRNALRVHTVRAHNQSKPGGQPMGQQQHQASSPPKICYEPQSQLPPGAIRVPVQQTQQHNHQQSIHPIAKKTGAEQQKQSAMYQPAPQKQMPTTSSTILNPPMVGRPQMYGHPMMMGHPMI